MKEVEDGSTDNIITSYHSPLNGMSPDNRPSSGEAKLDRDYSMYWYTLTTYQVSPPRGSLRWNSDVYIIYISHMHSNSAKIWIGATKFPNSDNIS